MFSALADFKIKHFTDMLKTFLLSRPATLFDATNVEHRKAYFEYLVTRTWAGCHFQFVLEEPFLDLPSCINHKMVQHYAGQEFSKTKQKVRTK